MISLLVICHPLFWVSYYCWWFRNPANQLIGSLSHSLQGFLDPRWCGISSSNTIILKPELRAFEVYSFNWTTNLGWPTGGLVAIIRRYRPPSPCPTTRPKPAQLNNANRIKFRKPCIHSHPSSPGHNIGTTTKQGRKFIFFLGISLGDVWLGGCFWRCVFCYSGSAFYLSWLDFILLFSLKTKMTFWSFWF